jgi:hypothetical protein
MMVLGMLCGVALFTANGNGMFKSSPQASAEGLEPLIDARIRTMQDPSLARISALEMQVSEVRSQLETISAASTVAISGTVAVAHPKALRSAVRGARARGLPAAVSTSVGVDSLEKLVDLDLVTKQILDENPTWKRADVEKVVHGLKTEKWTQPMWKGQTEKWFDELDCLAKHVLQTNKAGGIQRPFRVVQIGANNGNDALHESIARINEKYGDQLPIEVVLVEPTILNFLRCKRNYERNKRMAGVKKVYVNAAVSTSLCTPQHTTTIYHPKVSVALYCTCTALYSPPASTSLSA